ncbi:MAG: alginate export family protein [Candidatus Omnitrophota bacterium]
MLFLTMLLLFNVSFYAFAGEKEMKNIQIGDYIVDIGFDNCLRWESIEDYDFSSNDSYSKIYNRFRLNSKISYKDSFEVFVEGIDAREWVYNIKRGSQFDDFDLHQAYLYLSNIMDSNLSLKVGRQKLSYGKKRLLAAPTWSNQIRSFDAAVAKLEFSKLTSDLIFGNAVEYDSNNFNDSQEGEYLYGTYNTYKAFDFLLVDFYFLSQIDRKTIVTGEDGRVGHLERYTMGGRFNVEAAKDLNFDFEGDYQFGEKGTSDIDAYALSFYAEKKFSAIFSPKVKLEFNLASGDNDLTNNEYNTFIPVYQTTHGPYGIIDFFRWQNMREIALFTSFKPAAKLFLNPEFHWYWLDNEADAWYRSSGSKMFSNTTGNTASYVGSEYSLVASYELNKNTNFELGYSYFLCGDVAKKAGDNDGVSFGYLHTIIKF